MLANAGTDPVNDTDALSKLSDCSLYGRIGLGTSWLLLESVLPQGRRGLQSSREASVEFASGYPQVCEGGKHCYPDRTIRQKLQSLLADLWLSGLQKWKGMRRACVVDFFKILCYLRACEKCQIYSQEDKSPLPQNSDTKPQTSQIGLWSIQLNPLAHC